jgi:hypothetical protein
MMLGLSQATSMELELNLPHHPDPSLVGLSIKRLRSPRFHPLIR